MTDESPTVLIEISRDLPAWFGTRNENGARLSFELGEPTGSLGGSDGCAFDIYTPAITATDTGAHFCHCGDWRCHPAPAAAAVPGVTK